MKRAICAGMMLVASLLAKFETAKHWAFEPIRDVAPPDVQDKAWVKSSIDPFIRSRYGPLMGALMIPNTSRLCFDRYQ